MGLFRGIFHSLSTTDLTQWFHMTHRSLLNSQKILRNFRQNFLFASTFYLAMS
jgi:hypothetical protein